MSTSVRPRVTATTGVRADIQGLRALAVGLVLLNHLWPHRLTGGFVGVDVFFVISGFLITSHLLQRRPTTLRELLGFWARRVRRLLPAATLVLAATVLAAAIWLPAVHVVTTAEESIAAALYVENWKLASTATDYFAADQTASPVRHYWSLSVEEQFYVIWPLVLAAALLIGRRGRQAVWAGGAIALVLGASLVASVFLTFDDPARAYFVTSTRIWELALGGTLAFGMSSGHVARRWPDVSRPVLAWVGLGLIVGAAVTFSEQTAFPGWVALLPTLGAALVILASADGVAGAPDPLWRNRLVQTIGDASYSIYLWHWPLIVIVPAVLGHVLQWPDKIVIALVSVLLAILTKRWIEDPVRTHPAFADHVGRTFALGASLMAAVVALSLFTLTRAEAEIETAGRAGTVAVAGAGECAGAGAARHDDTCSFVGEELLTEPAFAATDLPDVYGDECWNRRPFTSRTTCTYGADDATVKIALIGNSHAGHWQPALAAIAAQRGWQITTYLVSECWLGDALQVFERPGDTKTCQDWVRWATTATASGDYDLVVTSNRTWRQVQGVDPGDRDTVAREAYSRTLDAWIGAHKKVLVMRDTPNLVENAPDCVEAHDDALDACVEPQNEVLVPDPLADAAGPYRSAGVEVLDLSDRFCRAGGCHAVVGGVIVFFDKGHMTTTYSRSLVPDIEPTVTRMLSDA